MILLGRDSAGDDGGENWILPAYPAREGVVRRVSEVSVAPGPAGAEHMKRRGAVVDTRIVVGLAKSIITMLALSCPGTLRAFLDWRDHTWGNRAALTELYSDLPYADLNGDVLRGYGSLLSVYIVPPCGWIDAKVSGREQALPSSSIRPPSAVS